MFKLVLISALLSTSSAIAQMAPVEVCSTHEVITSKLQERFQEQQTSVAIISDGRLLEIYTSEKGRTWTLIVTNTKGITCAISAGTDWFNKGFVEPRT